MSEKKKPVIALRGFKRSGAWPLDSASLFSNRDYVEPYGAACDYVRNDGSAYAGQLIAVDDYKRRKVALYIAAYGDDGKLFLQDVVLEGDDLFDFKGILGTTSELKAIADPEDKDMYIVESGDDAGAYVWSAVSGKWGLIKPGIQNATETESGLMSAGMYSSLAQGGKGKAGIYGNIGVSGSPETANSWIPLTKSASDPDISIPTEARVADMISTQAVNTSSFTIVPEYAKRDIGTNVTISAKLYNPSSYGKVFSIYSLNSKMRKDQTIVSGQSALMEDIQFSAPLALGANNFQADLLTGVGGTVLASKQFSITGYESLIATIDSEPNILQYSELGKDIEIEIPKGTETISLTLNNPSRSIARITCDGDDITSLFRQNAISGAMELLYKSEGGVLIPYPEDVSMQVRIG